MPHDTSPTPYWKRLETWFLAAAFLILVVTAFSAWWNWGKFASIRDKARASRDEVVQIQEVLSSLREAEAGQRGFLLTGKDAYLDSYRLGVNALPDQLKEARNLAGNEYSSVSELNALIAAKLQELKDTIAVRREQGADAALAIVMTDRSGELMNRIVALCRKISAAENRSYYQGVRQISVLSNEMMYISIGGDLVLCVLLVLAAISMTAAAGRREELIGALQDDERRLRDLQRKAEAAEERARNILESIGDGFVSVDRDWNVTYCNAEGAKILGRAAAEITGRNFWSEFPDAAAPEIEANYLQVAADRKPMSFEAFLPGRSSYWEQNVYPAQEGLSVYFRDVTQRRRFEERARHAHKLESLGVLAGGIAHDFNNLLTAILGSASLMQDELPTGSPALHLAENVIRASERASQLTRQMLAYSGRGRFVVEPTDLAVQVREITALLEASITSQVELVLDLQTDGVLVEADSGQIQQLVMNLVINGAEAIGLNGGEVRVSTRVQEVDARYIAEKLNGDEIQPGRFVVLEVRDTGAGMDDATLARIFDPFFTTKFTGRGLGLAAVHGIVRGHHGTIKVYSTPGQGTAFKVYFPAVSGQLAAVKLAPVKDFHGGGVVLVVDDEEVVQKLARSTLERYGYEVLVAANGKEAIDQFVQRKDRIGLVLLDMTMPVMSGEETLARLKQIQPSIKVIASSGYSEIEAVSRFGDGITAFLQKPYRSNQLAEKVKLTLS